MSFLGLIRRPAKAPVRSLEAIAHDVESFRMRQAKAARADVERRRALEFASTLGRVTQPMTPREQIAAEVAAKRARRKPSA